MRKLTFTIIIILTAFWVNAQQIKNIQKGAIQGTKKNYLTGKANSSRIEPNVHYNYIPSITGNVKGVKSVLSEGFEGTTFPPNDWTIINSGDANTWVRYTTTPHTGSACAAITYTTATAHDDYLITPKLVVTSGDNTLSAWFMSQSTTYPEPYDVMVSTTGTSASDFTLLVAEPDPGTTWVQKSYDLSAYNGQNIYVAFRSTTNDMWRLYIDDVTGPEIYTVADDAGVVSVDINAAVLPGSITPKATVKNFGSTSQDFDVELKINDGTSDIYTQTQTVTALAASTTTQLTFAPDWTATLGTYTITVTVTNTGDLDATNDIKTKTIIVANLADAYAGNTTAATYGSVNLTDGTITSTGTMSSTPFPMAEEFNGSSIYRINEDMTIGTVGPDGSYTNLGTMSGVSGTPTGLAYNWNTSTWYVMVLDANNLPQLCTLDINTYALTLVGTGTAGMIIGMDFAWDGFLYGPSLDDDILYKIDPTTGTLTAIGAIGVDINYGQDVSFDGVTGQLFSYTVGGSYDFGTYNLSTGAFTTITTPSASDQIATFVITKTPLAAYTITFTVNDGTNPIAGATIEINGVTLTTDASGNATYVYVDGTYAYTVSSPGYTTETGNVTIAGANVPVTVTLTLIPGNDAGITAITPNGNETTCGSGTENVIVTLKNFVGATLTSATINWTVNGVAQTPYSWIGVLGAGASADVTIGTYDFSAANTYAIIAATSAPNGASDDDATNDSYTESYVISTAASQLSENFDALTIPALPNGWSVVTNVVEWRTEDNTNLSANSDPNMIITYYDASSAKDDWFFTNALNLDASTTYQLSFWYDAPGYSGVPESMKVTLSSNPDATSTVSTLWDNASISTTAGTFEQATVTFSPTTTGCYYLGWYAYSAADVDYIAVDDINLSVYSKVNENSSISNISIYPNPATSTLTVANENALSIEIFNLNGQKVAEFNNTNTANVANLAQGTYMVKVVTNNNVFTQKINIVR